MNPNNALLYLFTLISFGLLSCQPKDTFDWGVGMSAPKFYGNGGPKVSFYYQGKSVAGASANIGFDPGWGQTSGGYVGGEILKPVPDSMAVSWICAVDQLEYKGGFILNREKLLALFRSDPVADMYGDKAPYSLLIAGFAPGGNLTLWAGAGRTLTEVGKYKAQNKGVWMEKDADYQKYLKEHREVSEGYKEAAIFRYLHGVPYHIWATGETEYNWDVGFTTEENKTDYSHSLSFYTQDGTFYWEDSNEMNTELTQWNTPYGKPNNNNIKNLKLPVQLTLTWVSPDQQHWYRSEITFPSDFKQKFTTPYTHPKTGKIERYNRIVIGMDKEEVNKPYTYGRIWLDGAGRQEELMRFRAAKLDVVTRKYKISKYSLPKNYQIPVWNGREPLVVPEVEFWREK